jgi:hypothetical protein
MHSKKKGNIGQFAVGLSLVKLGFSVFTEEGDISKIDMIAEKNNKLIKIQCKAITPDNGCIRVNLKKSGPNYKFRYKSDMFDYFGICDLEDHQIYLISSDVLQNHNNCINLRKVASKNNQKSKINMAADFLIDKVLADFN